MKIKSLFLLVVAAGLDSVPASGAVLFSEDFESLPLGPYVSASESGGDGTDWTDVAPSGWVRDQSTTPAGPPAEFFGWTFHDRASWIATEGDQDRSVWTGGTGTVMIADPDAYDDLTNIDTGLFNAYISTPAIALGNVTSPITISFDSSFRSEATQIANLDVTFDGVLFTNLFTLDGNALPDGQLFNDPVSIPVNHSGTGTAQFRFGLVNASNDWWWAIDNVVVSGDVVPEPSTSLLTLLPLIGLLRRRR